jgi:hypothetical protein
VGLPWCVVHLPLYLGNDRGAVPPALSLAVTLFSVLLPYRVLMVWVYDRTQSVLLVERTSWEGPRVAGAGRSHASSVRPVGRAGAPLPEVAGRTLQPVFITVKVGLIGSSLVFVPLTDAVVSPTDVRVAVDKEVG